jgi:hypothetical protein
MKALVTFQNQSSKATFSIVYDAIDLDTIKNAAAQGPVYLTLNNINHDRFSIVAIDTNDDLTKVTNSQTIDLQRSSKRISRLIEAAA